MGSDGDTLDQGYRLIRQWYYSEVKDIAEECRRLVQAGELADADDVYQWLHQTIDGHEVVIYTFKAKVSLIASDNEEAKLTVEQKAYAAMWRDVNDAAKLTVEQKAYAAMWRDVMDELGDVAELFKKEDK